jgi:hypothetical protein
VSDRLFRAVLSAMDRRMPRRRLLARMATGASALAVAPLRYLLQPVSAAAVIHCSDCSQGSKCCDGYTAFCCTLIGVNACPSYTYIAGWWKCTQYTGDGPCAAEGVRYYLDCNVLPDETCPNGCRCANGTCSHRGTCCNVFRYGQCNSDVPKDTAIACRLIKCVNPCTIFDDCDCTSKIDDVTCRHDEEAVCL